MIDNYGRLPWIKHPPSLQVAPVYEPSDVADLVTELSRLGNRVSVNYIRHDGPAAGGLIPDVAIALILGVPVTALLTELSKDAYATLKKTLLEHLARGRIQKGAKIYSPLGFAIESKDYGVDTWFIIRDSLLESEFIVAVSTIVGVYDTTTKEPGFSQTYYPIVFAYDSESREWADITDLDWRKAL